MTNKKTNGAAAPYTILEQPLFQRRKIRAIVIGAGPAGITFHYHASKLDWLDYTIYEREADVGGVWLKNRYPGCACDIPSPAFQFLFNTSPSWSKFYAPAREIHAYLKSTCDKFNIWSRVKLNTEVTSCQWNDADGLWHVEVTDRKTGERRLESAEILVNAGGILNRWKMPEIDGIESFTGKMMHSAAWDEEYDLTGKRVAVLGSGSSGIQIVPNIQPLVKSLHAFNRSRTWILPGVCASRTPDGKGANFIIPEEEKARLASDSAYMMQTRRDIEQEIASMYEAFVKGTPAQADWLEAALAHMLERLGGDKELFARLVPQFEVGCKRPTPGEGYLEAFTKKNVTLVTDGIKTIIPKGITTTAGETIEVDAIVCATGFDVSYAPAYPVIGRDQTTSLSQEWSKNPRAYFGMTCDGYPNMFHIFGPYAPVAHGSVMPGMDLAVQYILSIASKMSRCNISSVEIKSKSMQDFIEHADTWLPRSVWSGACSNWYTANGAGKLIVYPGTYPHCLEFLSEVRFEDYDITYRTGNSLAFLGNGFTQAETDKGSVTGYLDRYIPITAVKKA